MSSRDSAGSALLLVVGGTNIEIGRVMAESTKKKEKPKTKAATKAKASNNKARGSAAKWDEALILENRLEEKLLEDAILSAKLALLELEEETRKAPFERRSGLRLKEKAIKSERAFNRLRALRKGELLPERDAED